MARPKADYSATICSTCPKIGGPRMKGQCRKCYGRDYFQKTYKTEVLPAKTAALHRWRAANPERYRELNAKHNTRDKWVFWKYGLTRDEYEQKRAAQYGKCAVCHLDAKRLVLDHNHKTKEIREFLCDRCNMLIGFIEKSDVDALKAAFTYLEAHAKIDS
jgi:hypothetical protein